MVRHVCWLISTHIALLCLLVAAVCPPPPVVVGVVLGVAVGVLVGVPPPPVVVVVVVVVVVGVLVGMVAPVLLSAHTTNSIFLPANSFTFCLLICPHNNLCISSKLKEADAFNTKGGKCL